MLSEDRMMTLMQGTFDNLKLSGLIPKAIVVNSDTVLLGTGSPLDSLGFVTFVTELEDRVHRETGKEIYFALNDIQDFNISNPHLSASTFVKYITGLAI